MTAQSIVSQRVARELARVRPIDRSKARVYAWSEIIRGPNFDQQTWISQYLLDTERRAVWNPGDPLPLSTLQTLTTLLCNHVGMRPLTVLIEEHHIAAPSGPAIPASQAPRFKHQVWIHPDMRQRLTLAHEVAHKIAQWRSRTLNHGPLFLEAFAFCLSRSLPVDQETLENRIRASMVAFGLYPA